MRKSDTPTSSADHLQAIANSTTDALIAIDQAGKVISWNQAAASMFGFSADEMIGQSLHAIIPEKFHQLHDQGLERVGSGGKQHVIGQAVELAGLRNFGKDISRADIRRVRRTARFKRLRNKLKKSSKNGWKRAKSRAGTRRSA